MPDESLARLLASGSSLGGARPKASVTAAQGSLAIAKFPRHDDEIDVTRWEALALTLATRADKEVPRWQVKSVATCPVLLLYRFDRQGARRIPFLSAKSLLAAEDGEQRSYLEIADEIRRHGAFPHRDLQALWRRIVFNILISNTDDHLRNHGFLYVGPRGWTLSPAYDLNPVPTDVRPRILSTAIDLDDATPSLDLAFEVAQYFGFDNEEAAATAVQMGRAVGSWSAEAERVGLSKGEIDRMASAFEHDDLQALRRMAS